MPYKIKIAAAHYTGLKPANLGERRSLLKLCLYAAVTVAALVSVRLLQEHWQQVRELTWSSASGTILDARADRSLSAAFGYHPQSTYPEQVLVSYSISGAPQQRWITLRKPFIAPEAIQLDAQRWKGAHCIVRWNPANENQIDAEVS